MQTTLTLDDELAEELEEVAHRAGKPFTDVVNETLRKGLHPAVSPKPYRLETVSLGVRPGVDIDKARHIADALEDEEIARKLEMGEMILVDANLLIYAIDEESVHHAKAHAWIEQILSETTPVGIAWIVVLAFLRITTLKRLTRNALTSEQAIAYVDSWLAMPHVSLVLPGEQHWPILRNLIQLSGTTGNLTSDAHLAALAIEHEYTVFTADNDFRKFAGVSVVNPLVS